MSLPITVITPSLPARISERSRAITSVHAQTMRPEDHLVLVDHRKEGGHRPLNVLMKAVETEWTQILCDDDALMPEHFEKLWPLTANADIVYSPPTTIGPNPWTGYLEPFDAGRLRVSSIVSHIALVRTDLIRKVGGWDAGAGYDWNFWVKCLDAGARFARFNEPTWIYDLEEGKWHESRPDLAR